MLPLTAHWQNSFPHVSSTLSLIGRMIRTVAAERVLIGHMCSLFHQPRRLSSSWLDNGTEFCLTFFSFLWTPEIPFYGRNARLLQTINFRLGVSDFAASKISGFTVLRARIFVFCVSCMFAYFPDYWVSSLYACNDWIWGESGITLVVRSSAWFRSCIC